MVNMEILLFCTVCLTVVGITYYDKWATMLDKWVKPIFWQSGPAMIGYMIFRWLLYLSMYYMAYRVMGWVGPFFSMLCQFYLGRVLLRRFYRKRLFEWIQVYNKIALENHDDLSDPGVQERILKLASASTKDAMMNRNETPWNEMMDSL
jgi:hypothetical protein